MTYESFLSPGCVEPFTIRLWRFNFCLFLLGTKAGTLYKQTHTHTKVTSETFFLPVNKSRNIELPVKSAREHFQKVREFRWKKVSRATFVCVCVCVERVPALVQSRNRQKLKRHRRIVKGSTHPGDKKLS